MARMRGYIGGTAAIAGVCQIAKDRRARMAGLLKHLYMCKWRAVDKGFEVFESRGGVVDLAMIWVALMFFFALG